MYNNRKDNQMDKTILVVEVLKYSDGTKRYDIKKHASTLEKASEYMVSLKNLNERKDTTYELFNVLGQFEVERIEKVESGQDEIRF
jgi:hypothetical protein|tara:strand:- start:240 stop:497 length:258 start_codon:yes stop_codon:yes gene_type:complete